MTLYANTNGTLKEVSEKPFKLERDIQTLFEINLSEVMSLTLVRPEFSTKNTGHYGTGDYELQVENDSDLEYIMSLVKQVI